MNIEYIIQAAKESLDKKDKADLFKIISDNDIIFKTDKKLFIEIIKNLKVSAMRTCPHKILQTYQGEHYLAGNEDNYHNKKNYFSMIEKNEDIVLFYKEGLINLSDVKMWFKLLDSHFLLYLYHSLDGETDKEKLKNHMQNKYREIEQPGKVYYDILENNHISEINHIFDFENIIFNGVKIPQLSSKNMLHEIIRTYHYDKKAYAHLEKYPLFQDMKDSQGKTAQILTRILTTDNLENKYEKFRDHLSEFPLFPGIINVALSENKIKENYDFFKKVTKLIYHTEEDLKIPTVNNIKYKFFSHTMRKLMEESFENKKAYECLSEMREDYPEYFKEFFYGKNTMNNHTYLLSIERAILNESVKTQKLVSQKRL